jgi:hypothetical protein
MTSQAHGFAARAVDGVDGVASRRAPAREPFHGILGRMPFAYYDRLSQAEKRIYRASDAIESVGMPRGLDLGADVVALRAALSAEDRPAVQAVGQRVVDALTRGFHVPPVRLKVMAARPSDDYGELHGLYEPAEGRGRPLITVWMRTAQRRQVVAFKSFLRTICHEVCHHLDYELFALEETFHTEGFYKRESSLANALLGQEAAAGPSVRSG